MANITGIAVLTLGLSLFGFLTAIYTLLSNHVQQKSYGKKYVPYQNDNTIGGGRVISQTRVFPQGGEETLGQEVPWKYGPVFSKIHRNASEFLNSSRRYIVTNFTFSPGMGNQMFQYASLLAVGLKNSATFLIPEDFPLFRAFNLQRATVVSREVHDILLTEWSRPENRSLFRDCCRYYDAVHKLDFRQQRKLLGYFQSFRYFHPEFESEIREEFTFLPPIRKLAERLKKSAATTSLKISKGAKFVGVHVRRGIDMRLNQRNIIHGHKVAPLVYFRRAIGRLQSKFGKENTVFLASSDGVDWLKARIDNELRGENVFLVNSTFREVDMCVLSMCDSVVMSTGTYSWWAAYLARGQETIYYEHWPRIGSTLRKMMDKSDFFLANWTPAE